MADLYYGVAGTPVSHSLSPVLMNIMVQHVNSHLKTKDSFKLHCTDLIEESLIQDALAWGYVKSTPKIVDWDLTKSPFGKFRNSWLVLPITFVLTSVELIQLCLFMKLSFQCYLIATNCCNYISELQIFCTDKNFDCLSATHKEKISSAK